MSEKKLKFVGPIVILLGFLIYSTLFIVSEVQQAIVLQFGDPKRIVQKAGLNYKIPFIQNTVFLDTRILNLDAPPEEVIASDQKRLIVDAFARFQIKDPLQFYISVGNERVARSRLSTIVNARIRGVLGKEELQTLVSKDRARLMDQITKDVNAEAEKLGIKIIDVRIKRADLPQANSEAIYRRMQTEREREAKEFTAQILKGEGDGQRNKIFANAFGKDPRFFSFYRSMQSYEKSLIGKDTSLILSPDSDFFKYFGKSGTNQRRRAASPSAKKKQ